MSKLRFPDLWHLEKALTALGMVVSLAVIFAVFVLTAKTLGWVPGAVAAAVMLGFAAWAIVRFIPLSEYRK